MFFFSASPFVSLIMHFPADIVEHLLKSFFTSGFHDVCLVLICMMSAFLPTFGWSPQVLPPLPILPLHRPKGWDPCCNLQIKSQFNPLTPELNPSAQHWLTKFLMGIFLLEACISLIYAWKINKYTNYSFSLLDTTRPSTVFYRLLLNWASLRRH
jgi:hypothetical protein